MYPSRDRLVIFDADGTLIDAFPVVEQSFASHGMDIGNLERFQRRRKLLKYLGGLHEFPKNLRRQLDKENRRRFKQTLTDIYRQSANPFPGMAELLRQLIAAPGIRVGIVSRNITIEPEETLSQVLERHGVERNSLDFLRCIPLGDDKAPHFRALRDAYGINPVRAYACGDEYKDYAAAISSGMCAVISAYGFEALGRLVDDFHIPTESVAATSVELAARLRHALDLEAPPGEGADENPTAATRQE